MSVKNLLVTLSAFDPQAIFPAIDTPYAKCSTSNYVGSGPDVPAIRDIISRHREQLDTLDTILEQVNSLVRQLHAKHEQIASSMKTHEGFVSCIRRLPLDVLSEIFMWCLPNEKYLTPSNLAAPLLLTRICKGWRGVALGTPRLWCSLTIKDARKYPEQRLSIYRRWLANAGGCPLSLSIGGVGATLSRDSPIIAFLSLYTKRCRDIQISFYLADGLDLLLGDVPELESLCVYVRGLDAMTQNVSIVQPHPRLHKLIIHTPILNKNVLPHFNLEWTNLTHLGVLFTKDHFGDLDVLTLLQTCPNLEHLLFPQISAPRVQSPASFTHAKLRTLEFSILGLYGEGALVDTLILPNLRHFHLYGAYTDNFWQPLLNGSTDRALSITFGDYEDLYTNFGALFKIFQPGWTEITSITLDIQNAGDLGFLPLQFCPNLENMVVSFFYVINLRHAPLTHHKLGSLTIGVERGRLETLLDKLILPNLRELDVGMEFDWDHKSFEEFISRSNCQLETLKIRRVAISARQREELASLIPTLKLLKLHHTREKWRASG